MMTDSKCPLCNSSKLQTFLQRKRVPVHQNLVIRSASDATNTTRGDLDMVVCQDCGFVFNNCFDIEKLGYGEDYDNTQNCSAYFDDYLDNLVKNLVEVHGIRNGTIVEIGCGKGQFLRKLVEYPNSGLVAVGFDPSYVGPETILDGKIQFRSQYYDETCTNVAADFIICRHVIEHVPDPISLLSSTRQALVAAKSARVFFETPCVDWILKNKVVWDFFYEHCSLFTAESIVFAFEKSGFAVQNVEHIFGDQYLWLEAKYSKEEQQVSKFKAEASEQSTLDLALSYKLIEAELRDKWIARLKQLNQQGKVALWGAGAKGATLANLVDANQQLFDSVIDINPNKQGCFIPGTGHTIISPNEVNVREITTAILMNPNYRAEIELLLKENNISMTLLDWDSEDIL